MQGLIPLTSLGLFLSSRPKLIDVRSPREFSQGSIADSVNLPLLTDEERHLIGIEYKTKGQQAALDLGHRLVSGDIKRERISRWNSAVQDQGHCALFCARGGLRSQISQDWLSTTNPIPRIEGGYKAIRNVLLHEIESALSVLKSLVVTGTTGSGKTHFLFRFGDDPAIRSIDLERIAKHRGSAFGDVYGVQPTQASFENSLGISLLECRFHFPDSLLLLEDESSTIGRVTLPRPFFQKLLALPMVEIVLPLEQRVSNIIQDYFEGTRELLPDVEGASHQEKLENYFLRSLTKMRKKLGGARFEALRAKIAAGFQDQGAACSFEPHRVWIRELLQDYYDKYYLNHIERHRDRIRFSGPPDEVADWVSSYVENASSRIVE